jgi:hypothetical protein
MLRKNKRAAKPPTSRYTIATHLFLLQHPCSPTTPQRQTEINLEMNFLKSDYLNQIFIAASECLEKNFSFPKSDFTPFHITNAYLIHKILLTEGTNLLITLPTKEQQESILPISFLLPILKCFSHNTNLAKSIAIGDTIIKTDCGTISSVKTITDNQISVLPIGTLNRVTLTIDKPFVVLNQKIKEKVTEIQSRATLSQRQKGIENLKSKLLSEIKQHQTICDYLKDRTSILPPRHKRKVVVVASKKEVLQLIPASVPYQYINKSGEIYPDTHFDPILYVVNDFGTVKEFIIEKDIEIDTIIFVGDNKYRTTTSVSRLYRQGKLKHCIFIGTVDIESTDKFKIAKWNWTLPEAKHFLNATDSQINTLKISNSKLSKSIEEYIKIIDAAERKNENLINLKKSLRYIRKIYPTTALNSERIKSRSNDIFEEFEKEIEELFQDEYQGIDKEYKAEFEKLKDQFREIIYLLKNENAKAQWFKEQTKDIDYVVVPKVIKPYWEKELEKCLQSQQTVLKVRSLADLTNLNQPQEQSLQYYRGLKSTKVITLKEFEQKEADGKKYLFISLYGYGVYPENLLEKMYAKNVESSILLYEEEHRVFQYHLHKLHERTIQEFRSGDREGLVGIKYPETQIISVENIDEWIKYLIEADNFKFSKGAEIRYEITFEEISKKIRERESKTVYVEGYDEHHKEIHQLKKGDKVRIYQNPDIETLHDIIQMSDEKELFLRVDEFSGLWKKALREYAHSTALVKKLEAIVKKRYSLDSDENSTEHDKKTVRDEEELLKEIIVNDLNYKSHTYILNNIFEELVSNGLSVSKNQLENWMHPDSKTKFPKRKIDFSAIVKTVNNQELSSKWKYIMETSTEYLGTLNHKGRTFADEIDNYILSKEKGTMLNWLSDKHIDTIIADGAPLLTIKEIKKLDYEITD